MKTLLSNIVLFTLALALPHTCGANDDVVQVSLSENGTLVGHVFAMMEDEKAPIAGEVTLTSEGQTVSTLETDETGNFSFRDIQPGKYNMIGVAGSYVGNKVIEVTPFNAVVSVESNEETYTAVPLMVAPSYSPQDLDTYGAAPVQTFAGGCESCGATAPTYVEGYSAGGCSSCAGGGGFGGGGAFGGGGGFGGRGVGGATRFRRLALLGGTIGLAVGIRSNPSSADE